MGVIDTLSAGFDRITKSLWLIVLPALVDIAIWNGPRISVSDLSQQLAAALPSVSELGGQYQESLQLAREWLVSAGGQVNLLSLMSMRFLGLPSLSAASSPGGGLLAGAQAVVEVRTWSALAGVTLVLTLLSLLLGCFAVSWIAQGIREEPPDLRYVIQVALRSWARLAALGLVALICAVTVAFGVSMGYTVLVLVSPQLGALFLTLLLLGAVWISAYLGIIALFAPRAVILDDVGVWHSLVGSFLVVRRYLLSAIGFFLLASLIQTGLMYVWRLLAVNAAGTLFGILGNSYVSTGLVAASLIFYRDRIAAWQEIGTQAKTGGRQS